MFSNNDKLINNYQGKLYIVATPIGNLFDITQRALLILKEVDFIAAENIRRTAFLLKNFNINTPLLTLNSHNERQKINKLIKKIRDGYTIALVSNAGTPIINDPGYHLVRSCHKVNIQVIPIPGPCAAIAAISASGLSSIKFCYEGFLPYKSKERRNELKKLKNECRTLIFYESTHRIIDSLEDMLLILGNDRYVVLAREITKIWENIYGSPINELIKWLKADKNRYKGEIVLIVEGCKLPQFSVSDDALNTLNIFQNNMSFRKAVYLTSKIYRLKKNMLYKQALLLKDK